MNATASTDGPAAKSDRESGTSLPTVYIDVTNTLSVTFTTGIQRSVKEILKRLPQDDSRTFETVLIVRTGTGWRELADDEQRRLLTFPKMPGDVVERPRSTRRAHIAQRIDRLTKSRRVRPVRSQYDRLARKAKVERRRKQHQALGNVQFKAGSLFFDMEANWHADNRAEVLPELRRNGVRTGALVYDTLPVERPEWFDAGMQEKFARHLDAHLDQSEFFGVISNHVGAGLRGRWAEHNPESDPLETRTVHLGADLPRVRAKKPAIPKNINRFVLCVGTIEPRKNHDTLLDAFDRVLRDELDPATRDDYPPELRGLSLILVGKQGWDTAATVRRIRSHPAFGRRLLWFPKIDDAQLRWLYRSACTVVMPSFDEGLGLPVLEALASGCITLAADTPALVEAGGAAADYFDPNSSEQLARLIVRSIVDGDYRDERRRAIVQFRPPTWDGAAVDIMALLDAEFELAAEKRGEAEGENSERAVHPMVDEPHVGHR